GLVPGEHGPGHLLGDSGRDLVGNPLFVVQDGALDGAAGQVGGDRGEIVEGDGGRRGEGDRAVEGAVTGEDDRGGLGYVRTVGIRDGTVFRSGDLPGLLPRAEYLVQCA